MLITICSQFKWCQLDGFRLVSHLPPLFLLIRDITQNCPLNFTVYVLVCVLLTHFNKMQQLVKTTHCNVKLSAGMLLNCGVAKTFWESRSWDPTTISPDFFLVNDAEFETCIALSPLLLLTKDSMPSELGPGGDDRWLDDHWLGDGAWKERWVGDG